VIPASPIEIGVARPHGRDLRLAPILVSLAALLVASCTDSPAVFERRLYAMGTWVDLTVVATRDAADAVFAEAETFLRGFEVDYYAWADGGELARLNAALASGETATVSPQMAALLVDAKRISAASGGAFDPGVGELVELYGFHDATAEPRAPAPAEIDRLLAAGAGIASVDIDGREVRARARVLLDLGGIAKGEAVDRLVELLRSHGVRDALVNAGGDLRVLGSRDGRPWRIGIEDPRADRVLGVIALEDGEAAFTSGDYERFVEHDGERLHHILDPRTGRPAAATRAVTVIARRGVLADAAATALFVAGDDWADVADALDIDAVLRVDANGEVEATDEMHRRLVAGGGEEWHVVADS
jgi:thiamine biosynthesis lipoprotein